MQIIISLLSCSLNSFWYCLIGVLHETAKVRSSFLLHLLQLWRLVSYNHHLK